MPDVLLMECYEQPFTAAQAEEGGLKSVLTKAQQFLCKNDWCESRNQVVLRISNNGIPHCTCGVKMKKVYSKPKLLELHMPWAGRDCLR